MITKHTDPEIAMGESGGAGKKSRIITPNTGMEKVASNTHIPSKLKEMIREIKRGGDDKHVYLYNRALGSGEMYGPNNNGDYFPEDALRERHGTFVTNAHLFRHHQNKDPKNSIGDILASDYNDPLDTVDLIVKAPVDNIKDDLKKLRKGHVIATSMGCGVPFDVCSICGKKAKRRIGYCDHLKNNMLDVLPDGRQVYAVNTKPRFKDLSIVVVPAAPESGIFEKVASNFVEQDKQASEEILNQLVENGIDSRETRGVIHPKVVESMSHMKRASAIQTAHSAYGMLRPDEFKAFAEDDPEYITQKGIPYVNMKPGLSKKASLEGYPNMKVAEALEQVDTLPLEEEKLIASNFMGKMDKEAYLRYRKAWPLREQSNWRGVFVR